MNAYALPGLDQHLLRGADAGQLRKDAYDRICDDYDAMRDVYVDAAEHLAKYDDMPDVLRALDRAADMLSRLRDGEVTAADSTVSALLRELARQAALVQGRVSTVIYEHVEAAL